MERKNSRSLRFMTKGPRFYCFSFFFFFSVCALVSTISTTTTCLDMIRCPFSVEADTYSQEIEKRRDDGNMKEDILLSAMGTGRRFLSGLGSSPPRCTSKCDRCTPCKPVHVPVVPGTPVMAEYYPEAWRCKCGNKLYMP